jgi:two-component system, cell cycle response regulator DivK
MAQANARPHLAIVEDNEDGRLLLQMLLEEDYEVAGYEDGQSALDGMSATVPDLVLLDFSLPDMEGAEVLERLRAMPTLAKVPVVALTAHAQPGDRERFLNMGFDAYVSKPITDELVLFDAIEELLAGRG